MKNDAFPAYRKKIALKPTNLLRSLVKPVFSAKELDFVSDVILKEHIEPQASTKSTKKLPSKSQNKSKKEDLLSLLKKERSRISKEEKIVLHHVFSNKTLEDMANKKPKTKEEMLKVYGVGEEKFNRFGRHFLKYFEV